MLQRWMVALANNERGVALSTAILLPAPVGVAVKETNKNKNTFGTHGYYLIYVCLIKAECIFMLQIWKSCIAEQIKAQNNMLSRFLNLYNFSI